MLPLTVSGSVENSAFNDSNVVLSENVLWHLIGQQYCYGWFHWSTYNLDLHNWSLIWNRVQKESAVLWYFISKFPLIISSFGMSMTETRRRREASVSDTEYSENEQDGEVNRSSHCLMLICCVIKMLFTDWVSAECEWMSRLVNYYSLKKCMLQRSSCNHWTDVQACLHSLCSSPMTAVK